MGRADETTSGCTPLRCILLAFIAFGWRRTESGYSPPCAARHRRSARAASHGHIRHLRRLNVNTDVLGIVDFSLLSSMQFKLNTYVGSIVNMAESQDLLARGEGILVGLTPLPFGSIQAPRCDHSQQSGAMPSSCVRRAPAVRSRMPGPSQGRGSQSGGRTMTSPLTEL
jgi:hypothetical protein